MSEEIKQHINGVDVVMTAEEITAQKKRQTEAKISKDALIAKDNVIKNNRKSGNTKLLALGLSQAEATALTGYTPE